MWYYDTLRISIHYTIPDSELTCLICAVNGGCMDVLYVTYKILLTTARAC